MKIVGLPGTSTWESARDFQAPKMGRQCADSIRPLSRKGLREAKLAKLVAAWFEMGSHANQGPSQTIW